MFNNKKVLYSGKHSTGFRMFFTFLLLLVLVVHSGCTAAPVVQPAQSGIQSGVRGVQPQSVRYVVAAKGVLERFLGKQLPGRFRLGYIPAQQGRDVFEVKAAHGIVTVRGSSAVAICHGAYSYLKGKCHCMMTWSGKRVSLPLYLPDYPLHRVVCPYKWRFQDNICTFGYTTAFYKWPQWQHYLDWMALHGMNMQYAPVGGEAIWRRVWEKLGLSDKQISEYFTGPAFLPWHRMGNVNHHGGPIPDSFFPQTISLQKKILHRMRQLGIEPVAPAFSGFVPKGFKQVYPDAKVIELASWAGFQGLNRTYILHPLSPMYQKIGKMYITQWKKEFGDVHYFQADSFNELRVPVPADRQARLKRLAQYGKAVYSAIKAGDNQGTWVMMAWLFYNAGWFWDSGSIEAFLSDVPNNKMIILDLYAEAHPQWKRSKAFYGKQWVFSVIPNWGGRSQLGGNLPLYARLIPQVPYTKGVGNLVGFGISPEGTENNEVVYELLTDAAWSKHSVKLSDWLRSYCLARYGACPEPVYQAWLLLVKSVYGKEIHKTELFQARPHYASGNYGASANFKKAVKLFLSCSGQLKSQQLYRNDAIAFTAQYLARAVDQRLADATTALKADDKKVADTCMNQALAMMDNMDTLLNSHTIYRLERWVDMARAWGTTPAEKNYYEQDAKRQITLWGGPSLSEYAAKVWSGLIRGYYMTGWKLWYNAQRNNKPFNMRQWEEKWITTPTRFSHKTFADPVSQTRLLIKQADNWEPKNVMQTIFGKAVARWKRGQTTEQYKLRDWDISSFITGPGKYRILFSYTSGAHRLDIDWVCLMENKKEIARDSHYGTTGIVNKNNSYILDLKSYNPTAKYILRAKIKSAGGNNSNGIVYLKRIMSNGYENSWQEQS